MNIAIITNYQDWNPGYSLTNIVADQATMLDRFGHKPYVLVCESYNHSYDPPFVGKHLHKVVPFGHLIDYTKVEDWTPEHKKLSKKTADVLTRFFNEHEIDIAFTHDWVFTGWNMPYGLGIRQVKDLTKPVKWLHWIHSVPSINSNWWDIPAYGKGHKLVFPNATDRLRVAEQFRGTMEDVRVIPHIKDLRTYYEFDIDTCGLIDEYPGLMQADFVSVYPASADRLSAKRVEIVMAIMASLKARGFTVCLCIANQWATGRQPRENMDKYIEAARELGLEEDEFIFTSEWKIYPEVEELDDDGTLITKYARGISTRMLRELNLCSNLFIFPTREESFGLVGPEAALGGAFMVLNKNLDMMKEVFGGHGIYFDFGSFHNETRHKDPAQLWYQIGSIILGRTLENEAFRTRTWCRQMYNMDYLYVNRYEPIMEELLWDRSE